MKRKETMLAFGDATTRRKQDQKIFIIITVLVFMLYGNGIRNDYTLDDGIVITNNEFTKKGISGIKDIFLNDSFYGEPLLRNDNLVVGGRYRPLSIATFALEYQLFKRNPQISHFINIIIFLITVFFIYKLADKYLFPRHINKWYFSVPLVTALLFLFHPVHTEIVDSIKGRDELLCLLFCIIAIINSFKFFSSGKRLYLLLVFVSLFAALLSKENAITFVAIIPLTIYFFETNTNRKKYMLLSIPLITSAILFVALRTSVTYSLNSEALPYLINNPFIEATTAQRYATIAFIFGLYLKLLFIPHPLTYDYYPYHIQLADWNNLCVITNCIVGIGLLILAIVLFRKKGVVPFSILFFCITISPVSNILFPVGVFMSERFLYIPSVGFCLLMAFLFVKKIPAFTRGNSIYAMTILMVVIVLFSYKTIGRNKVWKSNHTLFATDVITSSGSIKSNFDYAIILSEDAEKSNDTVTKNELFLKALYHLKKAFTIYPKNATALLRYADISFKCRHNVDTCIFYYEKALSFDPKIKNIYNTLGTLYGQYKGDYNRAIIFFDKDILLNNGSVDTYKKLALSYFYKQDTAKALLFSEKSLELEPENPELIQIHEFLTKKMDH